MKPWNVATSLPRGGTLYINPGAGPVPGASEQNAIANMEQYIKDCKLTGLSFERSAAVDPGDGRYAFTVYGDDGFSIDVEMPGLPLDQVRYMDREKQNPWDFPRLYVGGGSWLWLYGLLDETWLPKDE